MTERRIFLTYATPNMAAQRDALARSAAANGFDDVRALGPEVLAGTPFATRNAETLSQPRGAGYWLWKPYLIQRALDGMAEGDVLLYCDAGRSLYYQFSRPPDALIDLAKSEGFLTGITTPQHGPLKRWSKRDCLVLMNADTPEIYEKPVIQATWSVWTRTEAAATFVKAWLDYCEDPRCLTDIDNTLGQQNLDGYRDHRHDQTISTILTYLHKAPFIDVAGTGYQRILSMRPQSRLANLFLKRPQDGDSVVRSAPTLPTLVAAQARIWRMAV